MPPVSKSKVTELSGIPWATRKLRNRKSRIPWLEPAGKQPDQVSTTPAADCEHAAVQVRARQARGAGAEEEALLLLQSEGLVLLARNHRCKCGELDLVMAQDDTAVVVEVRLRSNSRHGSALESVSIHKQRRVSRCARLWWMHHGQRIFQHLRFDVVAIESGSKVVWIQDAWQISD